MDTRIASRSSCGPGRKGDASPEELSELAGAVRKDRLLGRALVEATLRWEEERVVAAVRLLYAGRMREIKVDADTGRILDR